MKRLTRRSTLGGAAAATLAGFAYSARAATPVSGAFPSYYPPDYSKAVDASRAETGVLVYSNVGEMNWRPLLDKFKTKFPWINVQTLDLGGSEVFDRYYAEQATGKSAVDMVVSHSSASWLDFIKKGSVYPFTSAEDSKLPDWSKPAPGIYTVSADPYVIAYNKALLTEDQWPKSLADIVALVKKSPADFNKKIATGKPMASDAATNMLAHYINAVGEDKALAEFSVLGPASDLYSSAGPIMEKVTSGEYLIGYFLSGIQVFPLMADPTRASIMGYCLPSDGTVMLMRHLALAKTLKSPNSARLFSDYILSQEGQAALAAGGLVTYRSDVVLPDGPTGYTYQKIQQLIGAANVIPTTFNPKLLLPSQDLVAKVLAAYKLQS
jgi:iron(III) transport system substrate-binding protein